MHIPREEDKEANDLAQQAFGYKVVQLKMIHQTLSLAEVVAMDQQIVSND